MLDILRAAAVFHSRDIDELAEALGEDHPTPARVHRLPPRLRVIEGGQTGQQAD
ncbi:hypothetical protein [Lacimonas salitolerans]|uniref:Uncharacterized protein n=1 Tax=Lacimonas salitolerans TaxID=1323750 RepID=A0ABW4EK11_9RHOB